MKKTENLEQLLRMEHGPVPEPIRKEQAVNRLTEEFGRHPVSRQLPFYRKLAVQAGYLSPFTWVTQVGLFLAAAWLLLYSGAASFVQAVALAGMAPLFGLIGCTEIARSFSRNMWELEDVCRFPLRYVMSMRMLLLGMGDLLLFTLLLLFSAKGGSTLLLTAVCLLVPFHLANMVYLAMLMGTGGKCPMQMLTGAGIFMAVIFPYAISSVSGLTGAVSLTEAGMVFAGALDFTGCSGWIFLSFAGMVGMAVLFLKRNIWEVKKAWN